MDKAHQKLTADIGEVYRRLSEMVAEGEPGVLATVVRTRLSTPRHAGSKMIVHADGTVTGSIGGGKAEAVVVEEARRVLAEQTCRILELDLAGKLGVCGGNMEVFLEPVLHSTEFIVVGAGHIGRAMVKLGRELSFRFTVIDDRSDWLADLEAIAGVRALNVGPGELAEILEPTPGSSVLVASRNHELDGAYLRALLAVEQRSGLCFDFLGILGSHTKIASLKKRLLADGFDPLRMEKLQMPVGLDVGAETPGEIAMSILAEALAVCRGRSPVTDARGKALGVAYHRLRSRTDSSEHRDPDLEVT